MTPTILRKSLSFQAVRSAAIIQAIKAEHGTVGKFARHIGVSNPAVSGVIHGHWRSARIEAALAELVGYPVHVLFPREEKAA